MIAGHFASMVRPPGRFLVCSLIAAQLLILPGCADAPPARTMAPVTTATPDAASSATPAASPAAPSASPAPSPAAPPAPPAATSTPVEILFATNRAPDTDTENERYYSGDRGAISHGVATVGIPEGHMIGRHEEPSLLKFEWTRDDNKHINIRQVAPLSAEEFLLRLHLEMEESTDRRVMIFVPGYNADFAGATLVVGQFIADLKFRGPVILYSWPSQGRTASYTTDETNAEWAAEHFVDLLKTIQDEFPSGPVYLVGHSMGNRILGRAVTTLASDRPDTDLGMFREIVMIAPDIDADVFRKDLAPRIARTGIHTTVYASSNDRALKVSKLFHGYPRAGDAGEGLVVVPGVETIDASEASGGLLGHSYFSEDHRIMEDIFALLQSSQRADNRFNLQPVIIDGQRHWQFRK